MRESRRTVIATDHDQRIVPFATLLQFRQQHSDTGIPSGDLSEVIGQVLSDFRHIRQVRRHFSDECIRIDVPQLLTTALYPATVHVGRSEPITKRLIAIASLEKVLKVLASFFVQLLFGVLQRHAISDHSCDGLRKLIKPTSRLLKRILLATIRCIDRRAGTPDLERFPDVISSVPQEQRVARYCGIPNRTSQNRAPPGAPKVLAR